MSQEIPEPNPPLTPEEELAATKLTSDDLEIIEAAIFSSVGVHWRKLAMVVGRVKEKLEKEYPQFSHSFYATRVQMLVDKGRLDSQGDLEYMRFSEVRMPQES